MSNNFTIDLAAMSETLNSKSIQRLHKQIMLLKIMKIKSKEPKRTQKPISKQLGYTDSTIERYRDDIIMASPYDRKKYMKKNKQSNTSITHNQTHTQTKNSKKNKNTKNSKKDALKGGSLLGDQGQKAKYFIKARLVVDIIQLNDLRFDKQVKWNIQNNKQLCIV